MVTMELLVLVQTHRVQGGTHGTPARSEDRARQKYPNVLEDAL
jgi:hypothetical protein